MSFNVIEVKSASLYGKTEEYIRVQNMNDIVLWPYGVQFQIESSKSFIYARLYDGRRFIWPQLEHKPFTLDKAKSHYWLSIQGEDGASTGANVQVGDILHLVCQTQTCKQLANLIHVGNGQCWHFCSKVCLQYTVSQNVRRLTHQLEHLCRSQQDRLDAIDNLAAFGVKTNIRVDDTSKMHFEYIFLPN